MVYNKDVTDTKIKFKVGVKVEAFGDNTQFDESTFWIFGQFITMAKFDASYRHAFFATAIFNQLSIKVAFTILGES